jgi:hypothetical protein
MPEYLEELKETNETYKLQTAEIHNRQAFNPLKATEEELIKYNWQVYHGYKNNSSTYMFLMLATCDELALSGQIPYYYRFNKELLIKHLAPLSHLISCTRENVRDTRIPYMNAPECFRRYLNGSIQYAYMGKQSMHSLENQNYINEIIEEKGGRQYHDEIKYNNIEEEFNCNDDRRNDDRRNDDRRNYIR